MSVSEKVRSFIKEPSNLFVLEILLVYAAWKVFHHFVHSGTGTIDQQWSHLVFSIGSWYAGICSFILNRLGESTVHNGIDILFTDSRRVIWVQEHCLAIPALVIFTGSIGLFTGSWKNKLWFIPLGWLAIIFINIFRVVFLSLTFQHMSKRFYDINHSLIYVVITYALILAMIGWWMKKFSAPHPTVLPAFRVAPRGTGRTSPLSEGEGRT